MQNETAAKPGIGQYIKAIGPSIVISALVVGPGTVTTASQMGANYGYALLWVVVFAAISAFFYQLPAINVAISKECTIMEAVRMRFGKKIAIALYCCLVFSAVVFQAGNFTGAAMAMNYFVPAIPLVGWAAIMILLAFALVWTGKYGILENFAKVLIIMMVIAFVSTAIGTGPSVGQIASEGFTFAVPGGDYFLILAMLATTMVPDIPVSLSCFHKQRYLKKGSFEASLPRENKKKMALVDLVFGSVVTALITSSIIICSGTILHPAGIKVSAAADMAQQLTPVLGQYAGILFSCGLWAAAFSSGMTRIELLPMLLHQANGTEEDLTDKSSRIMMLVGAGVPLLFVILFGKSPAQLVVSAQAINGLLLPVIMFAIWRITGDKKFMGEDANKTWLNVIFGILQIVTLLLAFRVFKNLIGF